MHRLLPAFALLTLLVTSAAAQDAERQLDSPSKFNTEVSTSQTIREISLEAHANYLKCQNHYLNKWWDSDDSAGDVADAILGICIVVKEKWVDLAAGFTADEAQKFDDGKTSVMAWATTMRAEVRKRFLLAVVIERRSRPKAPNKPNQVGETVTHVPSGDGSLDRQRIARLQGALAAIGHDPGPVDGIMGAKTQAAIRAFEQRAGLPVTGEPSEQVERAIGRGLAGTAKAR